MQTTDVCHHTHVQALLVSPDRELVSVDVGMVVPVTTLWSFSVRTFNSCEGNEEEWRPYIQVHEGATDVALAALKTIDMEWAVEPHAGMSHPQRLVCMVPVWAAERAAKWLEELRH